MTKPPREPLPEQAEWGEGPLPLPGDYRVVSAGAPVAVCTLGSVELVEALADAEPVNVAVAGTLHTENLGIERVVLNMLAMPHLRYLVLCGQDASRAVGHMPGRSMLALAENGVDENNRIVGAPGRRPELLNIRPEHVAAFREQVEVIDRIGVTDAGGVIALADELAARGLGPYRSPAFDIRLPAQAAGKPKRLVPDPAGYLVVYPDRARRLLVLEHYTADGLLGAVIEAAEPAWLYVEATQRGFVSRMDHAAYLGVELARAEAALRFNVPYVQDRAPGEADPE